MDVVLDFLRPLDEGAALFLNSFANQSRVFDTCVGFLTASKLFKLLPLVLGLLWFWFKTTDMPRNTRMMVEAILSTVIAIAIAQALQTFMVERPRPIHDPGLGFVPPFTIRKDFLQGWSSFPSDHVTSAAALATSICLFRTRAGVFFLVWTALLIGLPRMYTGYHYLSDVLGGMFIGAGVALAVNRLWFMEKLSVRINAYSLSHPSLFHAVLFYILFEFTLMFEQVRILFGTFKFLWKLG
jgi:membrane-associated phospholipid phosphatase